MTDREANFAALGAALTVVAIGVILLVLTFFLAAPGESVGFSMGSSSDRLTLSSEEFYNETLVVTDYPYPGQTFVDNFIYIASEFGETVSDTSSVALFVSVRLVVGVVLVFVGSRMFSRSLALLRA